MNNIAVPSIQSTSFRRMAIAVGAAMIAFLAYSSVYAYRKPFTSADYGGLGFWGISYQSLLIISQVIGYMLSKFYGIKFISELRSLGRFKTSVILTGTAWLCLFLFAVVPAPYGMFFFFINGFMLGFMWGIIFSYVEGRRATDFIGAVLAISFIFAGGFTRSVAKWLMIECNVADKWMPFMTGLVFALPLLFFLWLLEKLPAPDESDIKERTVRLPMDKKSRKLFLKKFGAGLGMVTAVYLLLTVMRDARDNFMTNIWTDLGYANNYSIFTRTETNNSLIILLIMGMLVLIRKNIRALLIVHIVIAMGLALAGIATLLFINGKMEGALWMQLTGLGLYLGYIPFNCIFFERLIASFRVAGNVGFLIYFADAFGYLGSVVVILSKERMQLDLNWAEFYSQNIVLTGSLLGIAGTVFSYFYFRRKYSAAKK